MGNQVFDQIVIGGLEQFSVPHELGSSAASAGIFRFACFEDASYVPLMRLALTRWHRLV